jgi:beta-glucosidase
MLLSINKFTLLAICSLTLSAIAQSPTPPDPAIEQHITQTLNALTLEEKIDLIAGASVLGSTPIPRLGIPAFRMGDGPIGAHDPSPSTAFAAGIALVATWDRTLAQQIGNQIGRDSRSRGAAFLLGPGLNIYRAPLNGRNEEYFGEDPFLAGQIVVPYITGLQSQGVTATIKHFAANNSEFSRFNCDSIISERALREIYLPAFEAAVKQGHTGAIMNAYNRINGTWMTENAHINVDITKREWGFDGLIMSDWIAAHDPIAAANGGLDLEMPAPIVFNPTNLLPAIKSGKVSVATIDDKVRRLLRIAARFGWIVPDAKGPGWISHDPLDPTIPRYNQAGRQVALQSGIESATLLKNDASLLPLDPAKYQQIAVIGPNALPGYATGGGSGMVPPFFVNGPFRGISDYLGTRANVHYDQGIPRLDALAAQTGLTLTPDGAPGVTIDTYKNSDFTAKPSATRTETAINAGPYAQINQDPGAQPNLGISINATATEASEMKEAMRKSIAGALIPPTDSTRWTAYYHAKEAGKYLVYVEHPARYLLTIDGKPAIDHAEIAYATISQTLIELTAGVHKVVLDEYPVEPFVNGQTRLAIVKEDTLVSPSAIELAKRSDVVVVSVGFDTESEGEGADREYQLLPGQNELIQAIAAANPHTIVVLNAGGSVDASTWIDKVPALLHIWYSGEEGGTALAKILFGEANPSGRLPITWERAITDNPSYPYYYTQPATKGTTNRILYGDDIFVGYRGYQHNHTTPLFPFGFGLSYTTFQYSNLSITPAATGQLAYTVSFDITNTGSRSGADVAQLYVAEQNPSVPRPPEELKGFTRVDLKPGETQHVTLPLDARSFAWYDTTASAWHIDAATFNIHIGRSSTEIPLEGHIQIPYPTVLH